MSGVKVPRWLIAAAVFIGFVGIYQLSPVRTVTDSYWTVPTAASLLRARDADVDEYPDAIRNLDGWQVEVGSDGRHYYKVPLGASLAAVPFTAVALVLDRDGLDQHMQAGTATSLDPLIASIYTAGAVALMMLVAWEVGASVRAGLVLAVAFGLGTAAWSTTSRSLWMHGPSIFMLSLALLLLLKGRQRHAWLAGAGLALAAAFAIRPTNALPVVALAIWAAVTLRRDSWPFFAGGAVGAVVLGALNVVLYGEIVQPYSDPNRLAVTSQVFEAVAGNLVSPGRGLLIYSPVLAFAVLGAVMKWRAHDWTGLDTALAVVVLGHLLAISLFPHWWGGWSYGPRFMADVLPWLIWFLIPVVVEVIDGKPVPAPTVVTLLFAVALVWSVLVNARGALTDSTFLWNLNPTNVDDDPGRLWDWSDPPFLRSAEGLDVGSAPTG